jgi:hypothetical protein
MANHSPKISIVADVGVGSKMLLGALRLARHDGPFSISHFPFAIGGFKFKVQPSWTIQGTLIPRSGYISKPRVASTLG